MRRLQFVCWLGLALLAAQELVGQVPQAEPVAVTFAAHKTALQAVAFSSDGSRVLSACGQDLRIWDVATGKELSVHPGLGGQTVAFSPDGKSLANAGRDSVVIYDTETGKERLRIAANDAWTGGSAFPPRVSKLAYSADGRRLATGGSNGKVGGPHGFPGGIVKIWDAATGKELLRYSDLSSWPVSLAFSPDGKSIAAGTNGAGGELPEPGEVWVWDTAKDSLLASFKMAKDARPGDDTTSAGGVSISPDGKLLAVAVADGAVRVWELATERELPARKHEQWIWRVAFSPDGTRLISAGGDRAVRLWDTATGKEIKSFSFDTAQINVIAFSPDGRRIAAASGTNKSSGDVKVWNGPVD